MRRRIGSGAFATVWLAYDEHLDSSVAIKVLADNWSGDLHTRQRFLEEGRFLRKVESPHVVTVYDAGELDDDALRAATMEMAKRIADMPSVAVAGMKRNLFAAETDSFATVLDMEAYNQARCSQTEDHREAVAAFKEKRKPVFHGR